MPTKVIYLGEHPPQPPTNPPMLQPLAPGDAGWPTSPLLQPTQPVTQPMPAGPLPVLVQPSQPVPPATQPMVLMYPPPVSPAGSLFGSALLWLVVLLAVISTGVVVIMRVAPNQAAQITTQLRRPNTRTVTSSSATANSNLPTAQNALVQVRVTDLTADRLVVSIVNVSSQPLVLTGDTVQVRADAVNYFMPSDTPTVQLQPAGEHQIVISPVPVGASLVFRLQLPGADALELQVR